MEIVAFNGFEFEALGYWAGRPSPTTSLEWSSQPTVVRRTNNLALISPGPVLERTIDVEFGIEASSSAEAWLMLDRLIGILNPLDQTPRPLRALRNDGTSVVIQAYATLPSGLPTNEVNTLPVRFISADPKWLKEDPVTVSTPVASDAPILAMPNGGQAHVHPVYTITPDGARTSKTADVGWAHRKTLTFTNNGTKTLINVPRRINLGDTAALVTAGKMLANGDDLRVLLNGENVRRDLVGINTEQTYLWFVIEELAAGETITYDLIYGNDQAGAAQTMSRRNKPVFDIGGESGTATGGSTTTLVRSGAGWEVDRWKDGALIVLSGANAGTIALITGNTSTTLSFSAMGSAIGSGVRYVISMSRSDKWVYATRQTDRGSDTARGRWYLSSGESPPEETIFGNDAVGAWSRELYVDNRDKKGQRKWTRVTVGGDPDTFAILDAYRTYEGGPAVPEEGVADGVSLSVPFPVTAVTATLQFKNPNAITKAFFGGKVSAGDDWEEIDSDGAAHASLTDWSISESGLSYYHLYMGLIPNYDDEIGTQWKGDRGTTSAAGTTTTTTDATKDWEADQFNGGVIRFTSGTLSGQTRAITDTTATQITHAAFGGSTPADASYEIIGASLQANLVDKDRLVVTLDDDALDESLSGEQDVFQHAAEMWINDGTLANPIDHARVRIGQDGRMVFTEISPDTESLVLYSETRTAAVMDGDAVVRTLTDPAIVWEYGQGSTYVKAHGGMPLPIGDNALTNPSAATNADGWSLVASAGVTANLTRSTSEYVDAEGSFRVQITANSAGAGATVDLMHDAYVTIQGGQYVPFVAFTKTDGMADVTDKLCFAFYDADHVLVSTVIPGSAGVAHDWATTLNETDAPETARYVRPFVRFTDTVGGSTGSVYADAMDLGSPVLQVLDDVVDAPLLVSATYTEGFLG